MDLANLGARRVMVVTDRNVRGLAGGPVSVALGAIERESEMDRESGSDSHGVEGGEGKGSMEYEVFDRVAVEPKDTS